MHEDQDDFPLQDDLSNLLDLMDQFPVEDVDTDGRRLVSTVSPQDVAVPNYWEDIINVVQSDTSGPKRKPLPKNKPKRVLLPAEGGSIAEKPPIPVVRDTADDIATPERLRLIAEDIFGSERIDLQKSSSSRYNLVILFPDFIITNELGNTHRIRELYVQFVAEQGTTSWGVSFNGSRGTLTVSEVNTKYAHSHLPQAAVGGTWQSFCQGSSAFKVLTTALALKPTEGKWEMVLLSLENYLKWESLEGGPHVKMAAITTGERRNNPNYRTELRGWADQIPLDTFDFRSGLQLNPSEQLRKFYNCTSDIRGLSPSSSPDNVRAVSDHWHANNRMKITFRGVTPRMKIIPDDGATEDTFIDEVVITEYNTLLESYLVNFNKTIDYEYLRFRNRGRLGKIPSFQQADINYYKATAGKDRPSARSHRKQRVVGRVNNLRKREDNRFG